MSNTHILAILIDQRLQRWPNIETTLDQRLLFAGISHIQISSSFRPFTEIMTLYIWAEYWGTASSERVKTLN